MDTKLTIIDQLDRIDNLPTLPIIAQKIQQLINNERSNMTQIALLISKDQAISSKVVRLVNSAFFGLSNRVTSIQQAIVLLGLNAVTNIVIGISVVKVFADNVNGSLFDREMFWFHTFGTAMGAKLIAKELGRSEPEDYFLAGILHDIGVLIEDQFFHDLFIDVLKNAINNRIELVNSEHQIVGLTHQEIGEAVGQKWKLPPVLTHVIRYHHNPLDAPVDTPERSRDICKIVHVADVCANNKGINSGIPAGILKFDQSILRDLKIKEQKLDELNESMATEVRTLAKEWGI